MGFREESKITVPESLSQVFANSDEDRPSVGEIKKLLLTIASQSRISAVAYGVRNEGEKGNGNVAGITVSADKLALKVYLTINEMMALKRDLKDSTEQGADRLLSCLEQGSQSVVKWEEDDQGADAEDVVGSYGSAAPTWAAQNA